MLEGMLDSSNIDAFVLVSDVMDVKVSRTSLLYIATSTNSSTRKPSERSSAVTDSRPTLSNNEYMVLHTIMTTKKVFNITVNEEELTSSGGEKVKMQIITRILETNSQLLPSQLAVVVSLLHVWEERNETEIDWKTLEGKYLDKMLLEVGCDEVGENSPFILTHASSNDPIRRMKVNYIL